MRTLRGWSNQTLISCVGLRCCPNTKDMLFLPHAIITNKQSCVNSQTLVTFYELQLDIGRSFSLFSKYNLHETSNHNLLLEIKGMSVRFKADATSSHDLCFPCKR